MIERRRKRRRKLKRGSSAKKVDMTQLVARIRETRITGTPGTPERRKCASRLIRGISERADNCGRLLGNLSFWVDHRGSRRSGNRLGQSARNDGSQRAPPRGGTAMHEARSLRETSGNRRYYPFPGTRNKRARANGSLSFH